MRVPWYFLWQIALLLLLTSCHKKEDPGCLGCNSFQPCGDCNTLPVSKSISGTIYTNCSLEPYANKIVLLKLKYQSPCGGVKELNASGITDSSGFFNVPYDYVECPQIHWNLYGEIVLGGPHPITLPASGWNVDDITYIITDTAHLIYKLQTTSVTSLQDSVYILHPWTGAGWTAIAGPFSNNQIIAADYLPKSQLVNYTDSSTVCVHWRYNQQAEKQKTVNRYDCSSADTVLLTLP